VKFLWTAIASLVLATGLSLASEADETATFDVEKMTCATCPISVRKAIERVDGVKEAKVSFENKTVVVTFDPGVTTEVQIAQASTDVGFPATIRVAE